jgi:methionine sulfoxide reductase catalytic subunit
MWFQRTDSGFTHPVPSEITPQPLYLQRRVWLEGAAATAVGLGLTGVAGSTFAEGSANSLSLQRPGKLAPLPATSSRVAGAATPEKITPYSDASGYNNFYEFGLDKGDPARYAKAMSTQPWTVRVEGLVKTPKTFGWDDLLKLSPMEDRVYRLRCVEGWSMVIPWIGYSLSTLLKQVDPLGSAKYVEFVTLADPASMPGLRSSVLAWPYVEGLRLDEAMHPLTLLACGMYGEVLPKQNGAPIRLVVPWKYGFKSAKSLVKIRLLEKEPRTAWNVAAPQEYGFYSNVNPEVSHPRWSQAHERRLGDEGGLFAKRRATQMFNGYEAQVGQLYAGMDLRKSF